MRASQKVWAYIEKLPAPTPFTTHELMRLAPRAAVDQALSRLVKAQIIVRVTRGVFFRFKQSRFGPVPPYPEQVARKIAETFGATIEVHGDEAVRRFRLTTQMPVVPIFLTSGPPRKFYLGKLPVEMRHVSQRKMILAGRPAGTALTALIYLGKAEVTRVVIAKIKAILPPEEFKALKAATTAMPSWLSDALNHGRAPRGSRKPEIHY